MSSRELLERFLARARGFPGDVHCSERRSPGKPDDIIIFIVSLKAIIKYFMKVCHQPQFVTYFKADITTDFIHWSTVIFYFIAVDKCIDLKSLKNHNKI